MQVHVHVPGREVKHFGCRSSYRAVYLVMSGIVFWRHITCRASGRMHASAANSTPCPVTSHAVGHSLMLTIVHKPLLHHHLSHGLGLGLALASTFARVEWRGLTRRRGVPHVHEDGGRTEVKFVLGRVLQVETE